MKAYGFGVDIGGTTVKLGLFQVDGTLLDKWEIVTRTAENGRYILEDIAATLKDKMDEKSIAKEDVVGIGMGVPGPVNAEGVVLKCVNLGWGQFNVETALSDLVGLPVKAGNDANVAAMGELWQGGGIGRKNMVMVTLGTGVGGGIIVDGKMISGSHGAGGEIGHMLAKDGETDTCGCGKKGCLEQYASATGIVRSANQCLSNTDLKTVLRNLAEITAKDIFDAARSGDEVGKSLVDDLGKMLGIALARIAAVCDPDVFVIGGGVSKAGTILIEAIQKYYEIHAFHASVKTEFSLATLGNDAGMYGGVKLVLDL